MAGSWEREKNASSDADTIERFMRERVRAMLEKIVAEELEVALGAAVFDAPGSGGRIRGVGKRWTGPWGGGVSDKERLLQLRRLSGLCPHAVAEGFEPLLAHAQATSRIDVLDASAAGG